MRQHQGMCYSIDDDVDETVFSSRTELTEIQAIIIRGRVTLYRTKNNTGEEED